MRNETSKFAKDRKFARALYGALPLIALVLPTAAQATSAVNTATLTLPPGVTDSDLTNNTATDTDNVLAALTVANDTATGVSAATGATNVLNVFGNDKVNTANATATNSILSVASGSSVPAGLTFDTATGNVSVAAQTAPGTYTFNYSLCEAANPTNCKTATVSITVDAVIAPVTESGSGVSGTASSPIANVRSNDFVNGAAATATNSTIATSGTWQSGITLDTTTGAISIAASVQPGTYTLTYQLCDKSSPANCKTVDDTVTVTADIAPVTESGSGVSGTVSTPIANVRSNDKVNGVAATATNSTIATSGTWQSGITLDTTTGAISIAASVQPGTYTLTYQLCDKNSPANCKTVDDTVTVTANIAPSNDTGNSTSGTASTPIANVRSNDFVNGAAATATNSTIATSGSWPSGITLDTASGAVNVDATVQPGTYTLSYQLCDKSTPANCQTGTVTVTVAADILPVTETGTGVAFTASTPIADVRSNDKVNGVAATSSNSTISTDPVNPLPAGFTLDAATGAINIDNTVAAGSYNVWYKLCDKNSPSNCATVKDTVTVSNRQADLVLTKSNGATSVTSGQTTTYTLTVTNNGPDSVTGVVLKDTPGAGLTCPVTNPLSFSGSGIPVGSFTVQNLTSTGVTLGTLANGQSITVTYDCTVN